MIKYKYKNIDNKKLVLKKQEDIMYINFNNEKYIAYENNGIMIIYFGDLRTCKKYLQFLEKEENTKFDNIIRIDGAATFTPNSNIMRHVKKK